ncbi:PAS domain S-box protein [Cyanobium sp. FGCU-52]|nr:PAS domain S-box protein [Cyanobium sp. FGCU52]
MTAPWFSRLVPLAANAFARARDRLGPRRLHALLVFVPSATLVLFGAWSLAGGARSRVLDHLASEQTLAVRLALHSFTDPLAGNLRGLEVLANQPSLQNVVNDDSAAHRQALARDAIALADTLGSYDKVRWIDQDGRERVRVDWQGNRAVAVPDHELQNKGTRYFVLDTKALPQGSVYVSPLDLSVERGQVEVPYKPTLRFARALVDEAGRRRGILIVNVRAREMLEGFSSVARELNDDMMLVNAQGYGLRSPDGKDEWAFMFGRSPSIGRQFPDAWPLIRSQESGQQRLASGLWTWRAARPFPVQALTSEGSGSLQGPSPGGLQNANERSWTVVSRVEPRRLAALERQVSLPYAGTTALMLGALAGISSLVGTTLEQRRRAMERLEVLAENAADVVFRSSPEGVLEWMSPSVQEVLGYPPEALLGRRGPDLIVEEDLPRFQAAHEQVLAGSKAEFEARFRSVDGSPRWLAVSIRPLLDRRGALMGRAGHWRDIQEQVEARLAMAASEQRFELAMENAAVGMALVAPDGTFLRVNPALCGIFGRDVDNLLSCNWQTLTHPDDLAQDLARMRRLMQGSIPSYRLRKRFLKPDGSIVWGDLAVAAIRDGDGNVTMLIKQILDITETVTAQQGLAAQKEQFQLLAENASDVVLQTDHQHRLVWLSPSACDLFGSASATVLGTDFRDWIHPDDLPHLELMRRLGAVRGTSLRPDQGHMMRLLNPGGGYSWNAVRMRLVRDRGGAITGEVMALRDVDDLIEARKSLESERQFLRATLDSLLDPHLVLEPLYDADGRPVDLICADVNPSCLSYLGLDRSRLIGARLSSLMPGIVETGLMGLYINVLVSGEPLALDDYLYPNHETLSGDHRYDIRAMRSGERLTIAWRDVTERYEAAERLAVSEQRYRLLAENATDLVLRVREGRVLWISSNAQMILGAPADHWIGRSVLEMVPPQERQHYVEDQEVMAQGRTVSRRVRLITADGSGHWFSLHAKTFNDESGQPDGISASLRNIDAEMAAEAELDYRARHDHLTGLLNRHEALIQIEAITARLDRRRGHTAVLFIDVDKFKEVNDTYGHDAGNAVLQVLAERLRTTLRDGDLTARLGGDELLVALQGIVDLDQAVAVAEKIRAAGSQPILHEGSVIASSLSIGVALARSEESIDRLIARADQAMYRAKQAGRNQVIPIEAVPPGRGSRGPQAVAPQRFGVGSGRLMLG